MYIDTEAFSLRAPATQTPGKLTPIHNIDTKGRVTAERDGIHIAGGPPGTTGPSRVTRVAAFGVLIRPIDRS